MQTRAGFWRLNLSLGGPRQRFEQSLLRQAATCSKQRREAEDEND